MHIAAMAGPHESRAETGIEKIDEASK